MFMKSILEFLFGKKPDIFDDKGKVRHKFPDVFWQRWNRRFKTQEYNWKKHSGVRKTKHDKIVNH